MPRLTAAKGVRVVSDSLPVTESVDSVGAGTLSSVAVAGPPTPFNPNLVDSLTLRKAGLTAKVTSNLLKYRRKGGSFRKPADVAKIYGMTPETMARISGSLVFDAPVAGTSTVGAERFSSDQRKDAGLAVLSVGQPLTTPVQPVTTLPAVSPATYPQQNESSGTVAGMFELNTADTAQLQCLKGVGPVTADRLIRYRKQLGGYYNLAQLAEIKGLYPDVLARLQASLTVEPSHIVKIDLNKASLEKLKAHPYLDFYQAKVIVELRKARKKLTSLEELAAFKEFTPADLDRLQWYVTW